MNIIEKLKTKEGLNKVQGILFTIVSILLFILPLDSTKYQMLIPISKLAALIIMGLSSLYIVYIITLQKDIDNQIKQRMKKYIIIMISFFLIAVLIGGKSSIKPTIIMIMMFNIGIAFSHIDYKNVDKGLYIIDAGLIAYILSMIYQYLKLEEKPRSYSFIFNNPNYLGMICVLFVFICLIAYGISNCKRYYIYIIPLLYTAKLSLGRTSILGLISMILTFLLWNLISKNKGTYYTYVILILLFILSVTIIYPKLVSVEKVHQISSKVLEITGKNIFSGREKLWRESIDIIKEKPILGYGMGESLPNLSELEESTHNIYLKILIQGGLVLLIPLILALIRVWQKAYELKDMKLTKIGISCLIGILIIGVFELTLMGESISLGIIQWLIIGIGISPALYLKGNTDFKEMN